MTRVVGDWQNGYSTVAEGKRRNERNRPAIATGGSALVAPQSVDECGQLGHRGGGFHAFKTGWGESNEAARKPEGFPCPSVALRQLGFTHSGNAIIGDDGSQFAQ